MSSRINIRPLKTVDLKGRSEQIAEQMIEQLKDVREGPITVDADCLRELLFAYRLAATGSEQMADTMIELYHRLYATSYFWLVAEVLGEFDVRIAGIN